MCYRIFAFWLFLLLPFTSMSKTFYLDPIQGDLTNDGTALSPLPSLQAVYEAGLIQTQQYSPLPYDPAISSLIPVNVGAIIQAGDTLLLRDGLHGEFNTRGTFNSDFITIKNEDGHKPILKLIRMKSGSYWRFEGLEISSEPYDEYLNYRLVYFETHGWHGPVHNIEISECNIYSVQDIDQWNEDDWLTKASSGIHASGDTMLIKNNVLRNVDFGINLGGNKLTAIGNEITNFAGDGMRAIGDSILVESNLIRNCFKVDDNHDDGIQSFVPSSGRPVTNVTIRGNTIISNDGSDNPLIGTLQGIGCFDGPYHNWLIENNVIIVDHWHGISLYGAFDCVIRNNTVIDPSPDITPGPSWVRVNDHKDGTPSERCVVVNNICNTTATGAETATTSNLLIDTYAQYDENLIDYSSANVQLKAASIAIDAGDDTQAPLFDKNYISRPQGINSDIGAYEFVFTDTAVEQEEQNQFKYYPNPVYDFLIMESGVGNVYIYNQQGNPSELNIHRTDSKLYVDMRNLTDGIYYIGNKESGFRKIIKLQAGK